MAVLLVAMSVMAVMLTVAMPAWNQAARREKEAELVFRGEQYARAIGLFQRKYANAAPPSVDVLIQERFLRKKFKDPITNADFVPIPFAAQPPGPARGGGPAPVAPAPIQQAPGVSGGRGGIIGVTSASTAESIRVYNGATRYNEWRFVYVASTPTPGGGAPGSAVPGQPARGGFPGPPVRGGVPGVDGRGRGGAGPGLPSR